VNQYVWYKTNTTALSAGQGASAVGDFGITKIVVGGRYGTTGVAGTLSDEWVGDIAEVVIYHTALSAAETGAMDFYLTHKWLSSAAPGFNNLASAAFDVTSSGASPANAVYGPVLTHGGFVVRFQGTPGTTYTVESAPAVTGPWTKVTNLPAPTTDLGYGMGVFQFDEAVSTAPARFYRTVFPSY
jgi:hypothetical protein